MTKKTRRTNRWRSGEKEKEKVMVKNKYATDEKRTNGVRYILIGKKRTARRGREPTRYLREKRTRREEKTTLWGRRRRRWKRERI